MGVFWKPIPSTLYKYLGPDRADSIDSGEFRLTPPNQFNDPFEALPRVRRPNRESVRKKLKPGEDLDDLMQRAGPYFQEHGPRNVLDSVSEIFGLFSLASVTRHPLLWGHYADGHRGFAVGFNPQHEWFHVPKSPQPPIDAVRPISYRWLRPKVDIGYMQDFTTAQVNRMAENMLFAKHRAWHYEKEWRLARPLADADKVIVVGGEDIHLFTVPADAITELIVGARASDTLVDQLQPTAAALGIDVYRARISRRSYRLTIHRLGTA